MDFQNISISDGVILVKTARKVVSQYLINQKKISDSIFNEKFSFKAGVFVTINDNSGLRGCIGYPLAVKKLSYALTDAAINASTNDPRFTPVSLDDLKELIFEVTVLSETEEIFSQSPDEIFNQIKIGRDGLIIENGFQSGLLLPQIPIEYNWTVEEFLNHTCNKAGLENDSWKDDRTKILKFQGMIFKELSPNGEIIHEKFQ